MLCSTHVCRGHHVFVFWTQLQEEHQERDSWVNEGNGLGVLQHRSFLPVFTLLTLRSMVLKLHRLDFPTACIFAWYTQTLLNPLLGTFGLFYIVTTVMLWRCYTETLLASLLPREDQSPTPTLPLCTLRESQESQLGHLAGHMSPCPGRPLLSSDEVLTLVGWNSSTLWMVISIFKWFLVLWKTFWLTNLCLIYQTGIWECVFIKADCCLNSFGLIIKVVMFKN